MQAPHQPAATLAFKALLAGLLAGLLLVFAWPADGFTPLVGLAFVPLFWLVDQGFGPRVKYFSLFLALLVWNVGTTWWMWHSTAVGAVAAILANSLLMLLPWVGRAWLVKRTPAALHFWGFVFLWMGFEWLHLNWEISWPWLTLGNAFANHPQWVRWYNITGVAGGSLWILLQNGLVYQALKAWGNNSLPRQQKMSWSLASLALPLVLWGASHFLYHNTAVDQPTEQGSDQRKTASLAQGTSATNPPNVVVVQPNIDPYQKFELAQADQQLEHLLALTQSAIDSQTRLVIWPETAMSVAEWQDRIPQNPYYQKLFQFLAQHPQLRLLSGVESFKNHGPTTESPTARRLDNGQYYDVYNAALWAGGGQPLQFYNKSKLVPGVESLPSFLRWLSPVFEQFGGSTGGYGRNDSAQVFRDASNPYAAAPIICYESIYGAYVGEYAKQNANLLAIITNDGWWGNTPGHRQHLAYARLRAIEQELWVVRSANTGISAIIDPQGNLVKTLGWDQAGTLTFNVPTQMTSRSFYARNGDLLYAFCASLGLATVLFASWRHRANKIR
ncbi:MAG: apolipoprotein N-acyltransferase [Sphingobacteriia bacterium]|nr:MAG: apolipoprotein N-acyltransferase [Sphingobacteriia bacterium]